MGKFGKAIAAVSLGISLNSAFVFAEDTGYTASGNTAEEETNETFVENLSEDQKEELVTGLAVAEEKTDNYTVNLDADEDVDLDALAAYLTENDVKMTDEGKVSWDITAEKYSGDILVLDITPKYANFDLGEFYANKPVTITIDVSNLFASDVETVTVVHKHGNTETTYKGVAVKDGKITFTNDKGFSIFEITPEKVEEPEEPSAPTQEKMETPETDKATETKTKEPEKKAENGKKKATNTGAK